jgi:hypothetical protein
MNKFKKIIKLFFNIITLFIVPTIKKINKYIKDNNKFKM